MKSETTNVVTDKRTSRKRKIDLPALIQKIQASAKLILKACGIGAVAGVVINFGTPKEYTASTLIAPESTRRSSSSDMSALTDMADMSSFTTGKREAIYPSLYPIVIHSTPFLIPLFNVQVRERQDSTTITLARYLNERQKRPWWSIITSAPSRLVSRTMSLFMKKPEVEKEKSGSETDLFHLTREETGIAGVIGSRIKVGVNKKKRTITISVTMQDPLVAAIIADTVRVRLKEYITEYRTGKAREILKYTEKLREEAQAEYYAAQDKYTRYADANRNLAMLTSRAELARLRNEMSLAYNTYNQMKLQVQAAQAKVEKVTPVYAVIQPVVVPLAPSKPRKTLILAGCILLGAAGSIGWILFVKDFIENIKRWNKII